MRTVLRDNTLEAKFQRDGYVEIPFISQKEVAALKAKFFDLLPKSGGNITSSETVGTSVNDITYDFTFIDKNVAYKKAVFEVITKYFEPHVKQWLADFKPIIANYIRKKTETGEVPLHQNWAFADEHKCSTVSIWCPLVDSFEANGTLQVVPGSHKRFGEIRGPMIPWELYGIRDQIIANYLKPLNVKAGNAIVLDDSIVHYSAINKTNDLRLAIQLILIPEEVSSIHFFMKPAESLSDVEVLEVNKDFYMQFNPWKQPEGVKCIDHLKFEDRPIDIKEFERRLRGQRYDEIKKMGFIAKLKAVFS